MRACLHLLREALFSEAVSSAAQGSIGLLRLHRLKLPLYLASLVDVQEGSNPEKVLHCDA